MRAHTSDNELAVRAVDGDHRAYSVLVRRHAPSLAQAARGFGVPETDVDDVVQDTFVAAWRRLCDYDPVRPFRGWLFRIGLNKIRDLHRSRRVRRFLFGASPIDGAKALALPTDEPGPERQAAAVLDLRAVQAVLAQLDRDLREALVLTAITGLSQPEAALALGTSVKAIEGRVLRARRRLSELLG